MEPPANDNHLPTAYQPWRAICATCRVEMTIRDTPQCWDCLHADDAVPDPELDSLWAALVAGVGKKIRPRLRRDASCMDTEPDRPRW